MSAANIVASFTKAKLEQIVKLDSVGAALA